MKIILENLITSVTASSENSSYPDENVLDEHPKRVWKADSADSASLVCNVSSGANAIAIFNTNAQSISVSIADPNELTWEDVEWDGLDWLFAESQASIDLDAQGSTSALWGTFTLTTFPSEITITLATATGTVLEAGIVIIGSALSFKNPHYGLAQGLVDYSVSAILANGASYYNKQDIVRTFSGTLIEGLDSEFYSFMNDFARDYGLEPKAMRITDADSFEWVCYARFAEMPQSQHSYPSYSSINFSFIEVI